jgi:5-(carboxyamino)imidazole ribonucleotide synthase
MLNLLGELWYMEGGVAPAEPAWDRVLALPGTHLHLYGKVEPRPGRKMGHLTITAGHVESVRATAAQVASILGLLPLPQ